jgi:hypothetical protein
MEPTVVYLNGAFRTWRETRRGMVLRLSTKREIAEAQRRDNVTCMHECFPPGCGNCGFFPVVEEIEMLKRLVKMNPGIETVLYIKRKADEIDERMSAKYPWWREEVERTRPEREAMELAVALRARRAILRWYPDSIEAMEIAETEEELTRRIAEVEATIPEWRTE